MTEQGLFFLLCMQWLDRFGWKAETNSKLRYLLDTKEEVSKDYNVIGQPETVIIDETGVIVERFSVPTT